MEIGVKHEWVESFCVEVQGKAEFDAVWKVLKKEFPASSREAETLYNPNSFTGKGYIKWSLDDAVMWSSPTQTWSESMHSLNLSSLRGFLTSCGIEVDEISPSEEISEIELDLEFDDVLYEEATTADAREFVSLLDHTARLSAEILELQSQAQNKLETLDSLNQKKERLRKLLNIKDHE